MSYLHLSPTSRPLSCLVVVCLLGTGMGFSPSSAPAQSSITGGEAECTDGSAGPYACRKVDLLSFLTIADLGPGGGQVNDVWGWTDPQTRTEYALVGRTGGTAVVDVSIPTDPTLVGNLPTHSGPSTWRDVKVHEDHAFIVSEAAGHGMQILDLTQLRDVSSSERPVTFSETAHYDDIEAAHNVVVSPEGEFAYIVGGNGSGTTCGGGLHMVDVQAPANPTFAGCFADPSTGRAGTGYTHDAQCVVYKGPDSDYQGREVCFNANETALNVADVTDKDAPSTIANATYPQVGYTHQAWLTEDQRYLYLDDELDESRGLVGKTRTLVFDVTDLDNPELATSYQGPTGAIDHNQYIEGSYSYQANYQSGLRILDVSEPESPGEVGYFDTYPEGNNASFDGAWSTYPFFERNMVLVSSIEEGLFVLQPIPAPILSFTGTRQARSARLQWSVSASAQTDNIVIEHKPPGANFWREAGTVPSRSGDSVQEYKYSLDDLVLGTHRMRVRHVSTDGTTRTSNPIEVRILPTDPYVTTGPAPNPVQSQATFEIILREAQDLRIALYDAMGRRVEVLHDGPIQDGVNRRFQIGAAQRASGTYFLRAQGESIQLTRKVAVVR